VRTLFRAPGPRRGSLALLALVWCVAALSASAEEPVAAQTTARERELVVVVPEDAISFDPARFVRHQVTEILQRLLYRRLLTREGGAFGFDLARAIEMVDERTWRIEIAPGQATAEGRALSPQAIARHFQRLLQDPAFDGSPSAARGRFEHVASVSAEGESVVFRLHRPWPGLLAALTREPVALVGPAGEVIATGAFRIERWDPGNRILLKRVVPAGEGAPARIRIDVVASAQERLRRVLSGQAHIAIGLPAGALAKLSTSNRTKPVVVAQARVHFVEFDVTRPPFDDARVRRALNLAVDMQALVDGLMDDEAVRVATLLSPVTLGFDPQVPPIGYDPLLAKELLAAAGYPAGFDFELDAPATKWREAEAIREMLARVGVNAVVRIWSDWARLKEQILLGNRQAWLGEWGNSSLDPAGSIWPKLHSKGEANYGGYRDDALDGLLEEAETRLPPDERLAAYATVQRYLRQQAPMLFGYALYEVYGVDSRLDWAPAADGALDLGAARWRE